MMGCAAKGGTLKGRHPQYRVSSAFLRSLDVKMALEAMLSTQTCKAGLYTGRARLWFTQETCWLPE